MVWVRQDVQRAAELEHFRRWHCRRRIPDAFLVHALVCVIVMCLVYAINIADRYVVSTVLEPIRLDLRLNDGGVGFLTGVPLALFYVSLGIPMSWLADRTNRRNILAASLIVWSGVHRAVRPVAQLLAVLWRPHRRRHRRNGRHAAREFHHRGLLSGGPASHGLGVFALGAPIGAWLGADMAGAVAHAYGWRAAFLALGIPGVVLGVMVYLTIREPPRRGRRWTRGAATRRVPRCSSRCGSCGGSGRHFTWSWHPGCARCGAGG